MKQIKPTIIYNETPWTPIVPLNYKTQITNTQWAVLDINPRPSNPASDSDRQNHRPSSVLIPILPACKERGTETGTKCASCPPCKGSVSLATGSSAASAQHFLGLPRPGFQPNANRAF